MLQGGNIKAAKDHDGKKFQSKPIEIDDTANTGGQFTLELFTMIFCGPNFGVSLCFEPTMGR